jgi:peroxiredoxin
MTALVVTEFVSAAGGPARAAESAPDVGDPAPVFTLKDQAGNDVALADFKGKSHVLLAFYPKDFSTVCSNEMKCIRKKQHQLDDRGVTILAVSVDGPESHARFARSLGLRFPLLSDVSLDTAKSYGVHSPSPSGGFATRSVFLIDREGVLRHVDRDFRVPRDLGESPLFEAVNALEDGGGDPFAALAELPSPEREGKTLLGRSVMAVLAEDIPAIEALLHPTFRALPGEAEEATKKRRTEFLDLCKTTFEKHDLSGKKLSDVLRLSDALVLDREHATADRLKPFRSQVRTLATGLAPGNVLVVVRGRGLLGKDGATVLDREIAIVMRKESETWMIVELSGR